MAVVSATVHVVLATRAQNLAAAGVLVAMAFACLTCTRALWRGGSLRSWMRMLGMAGVMLFAHWELCFACGPEVHATGGRGGLASFALLLMAAEIVLAATAVVRSLQHPNPNREVALP